MESEEPKESQCEKQEFKDCEARSSSSAQTESVADATKRIVAQGEDIGERIDRLVLQAFASGKAGVDQVAKVSHEVLDGLAAALSNITPEEREQRIEKTFEGLESGIEKTINAVSLALQEASARGEKFATEDLAKTLEDLKSLESLYVEIIGSLLKNSSSEITAQVKAFRSHASRVVENLTPAIQSLFEVAKDRPVQFTEAAIGSFASSLGSALRKIGDALDPNGS